MSKGQLYVVLMLPLIAIISGCSAMGQNNFSCAGPGGGVACLPASEVYEITNDPELYEAVNEALKAAQESGEEYDTRAIVAGVRANHKPSIEVTKPMAAPVKQPLPVLRPAHVIRIWMDAWVDQKGDLHMPGYVFSEITPRRWSFGEPAISGSDVLAPVQVDRSGGEKGNEVSPN